MQNKQGGIVQIKQRNIFQGAKRPKRSQSRLCHACSVAWCQRPARANTAFKGRKDELKTVPHVHLGLVLCDTTAKLLPCNADGLGCGSKQ